MDDSQSTLTKRPREFGNPYAMLSILPDEQLESVKAVQPRPETSVNDRERKLTVSTPTLSSDILTNAIKSNAAAFRCRRRLQTGGGAGDKVFPPTYAGAAYAVEQRRLAGREQTVACVLLDSVQSQANRMEQALQEALDANEIALPIIEVDLSDAKDLPEPIGKITSLQVPHRLADAILRDSEDNGKRFEDSAAGKALDQAIPLNATPLFQFCPTALLFGMWNSTGRLKGGLGAKFERAIVSEVIGVGASFGIRTASRIDPLITKTKGIVLYQKPDGSWTLEESEAAKRKGKPIKLGSTDSKEGDGKVSQANLGNVTPSFAKYAKGAEGFDPMRFSELDFEYAVRTAGDELTVRARSKGGQQEEAAKGRIAPGGVTIEFAEQITTLSLIALRRLRFPVDGKPATAAANAAGHAVLTALGLCAATLAFESGMGLRSRCLLWPEEPMTWELLAKPGETPKQFTLAASDGKKLLADAVAAAKAAGLVWRTERLTLKPSAELVKLVRLSQEQAKKLGAEAEEA